jgi:hypothetical protein
LSKTRSAQLKASEAFQFSPYQLKYPDRYFLYLAASLPCRFKALGELKGLSAIPIPS